MILQISTLMKGPSLSLKGSTRSFLPWAFRIKSFLKADAWCLTLIKFCHNYTAPSCQITFRFLLKSLSSLDSYINRAAAAETPKWFARRQPLSLLGKADGSSFRRRRQFRNVIPIPDHGLEYNRVFKNVEPIGDSGFKCFLISITVGTRWFIKRKN